MERAFFESWSDFHVAMVGATAALAGLVIVAASVNIADIVKARSLTARLAAAIAALVGALTGSAIGLVPTITPLGYGLALVVVAIAVATFQVQAARMIYAHRRPGNRLQPAQAISGFVAPVVSLAGGALLATGHADGLVWFATGSIVAIIYGLSISWIVLVEVLR